MAANFMMFTSQQGNMLVVFFIAHLLSDFVLQTLGMVKNKQWLALPMFMHIAVVFVSTGILSNQWVASFFIALAHYGIDGSKMELQKRFPKQVLSFFLLDQLAHVLIILAVWATVWHIWPLLLSAFTLPFTNYKMSLILLSYLLVASPLGFVIKFATMHIAQYRHKNITEEENIKVENGGKLIGIFERIIILTLVLLNQYEAIGFLITGKSIIRFADKNSDLKSEYVLVGTMMSYALAILIGVVVKWLLAM